MPRRLPGPRRVRVRGVPLRTRVRRRLVPVRGAALLLELLRPRDLLAVGPLRLRARLRRRGLLDSGARLPVELHGPRRLPELECTCDFGFAGPDCSAVVGGCRATARRTASACVVRASASPASRETTVASPRPFLVPGQLLGARRLCLGECACGRGLRRPGLRARPPGVPRQLLGARAVCGCGTERGAERAAAGGAASSGAPPRVALRVRAGLPRRRLRRARRLPGQLHGGTARASAVPAATSASPRPIARRSSRRASATARHGKCVDGVCLCRRGSSATQDRRAGACPRNCTGHGECDERTGSCVCDTGCRGPATPAGASPSAPRRPPRHLPSTSLPPDRRAGTRGSTAASSTRRAR